jgi:hypothetical protein
MSLMTTKTFSLGGDLTINRLGSGRLVGAAGNGTMTVEPYYISAPSPPAHPLT